MIEVFKTNVTDDEQAHKLVHIIHAAYPDYKANFDLHDCDNILRIECIDKPVNADRVIFLLQKYSCYAEVLEDSL